MTADALIEDRRVFTIAGWLSGRARVSELDWMRRLSFGAAHLLRYLLAKLKSHARSAAACRMTSYRAVTYARCARISRWTAWRRLRELLAQGFIQTLGGRESIRVLISPPPGVEISPAGNASLTPRVRRVRKREAATKSKSGLVARMLPVSLARLRDLGWPSGSKRAYFDWLHGAQKTLSQEGVCDPVWVESSKAQARAPRKAEQPSQPLGSLKTDRRHPFGRKMTLGGAAEVRVTPKMGLAETQTPKTEGDPPRLETPQTYGAQTDSVTDSRRISGAECEGHFHPRPGGRASKAR